jgi:hypothetical protein
MPPQSRPERRREENKVKDNKKRETSEERKKREDAEDEEMEKACEKWCGRYQYTLTFIPISCDEQDARTHARVCMHVCVTLYLNTLRMCLCVCVYVF